MEEEPGGEDAAEPALGGFSGWSAERDRPGLTGQTYRSPARPSLSVT